MKFTISKFNCVIFGDKTSILKLFYRNKSIVSMVLVWFFLLGCENNQPEKMIAHLSGYWQIEKVSLSTGTTKDYNFSETIDYIEVQDSMTGFRKKMKPRLDGTYKTSRSLERFRLKIKNDSLHIYYTTPFDNWKETVLKANEDQLLIINAQKDIYSYVPYKPISIEQ